MHLLTGFLLTALLGRKNAPSRVRLPSFPGILETVSALPGRVRFRTPAIIGQPAAASGVQERLGGLEGVQSAEASAVTGSVLLRYDDKQVDPMILFAAVIRLLGLEQHIGKAPRSSVGRHIREAGAALNQAVHERTGGVIDLWTGLPLVLVALGIRNVLTRNGQLGWPLLWWAYMAMFPPGRNPE
jgi:hypothetical protein